MSPKCPIPGCRAKASSLMCDGHWQLVPHPVVNALNETERTRLQARDDATKRRAEIEHRAAWDMAVTFAAVRARDMVPA